MSSVFPFIDGDDGLLTESTEQLPLYKEVAWDFITDKAIFHDGKPKIVEKNEAIKVWIYKAIKTARYHYEIYTWDYGSEVETLLGKGYERGLTESEAIRYVREAILVNPYVLKVYNLVVTFKDDVLHVDGEIDTIYGRFNYSD